MKCLWYHIFYKVKKDTSILMWSIFLLYFYLQAGKHRLFLNILLFWKLPAPNIVKESMMYFVDNYNHTQYKSIFEKVAINHIQFEQIPPFEDGNCRTGRLLINFELLKNNIAPIVIPKEERTKYRHQWLININLKSS